MKNPREISVLRKYIEQILREDDGSLAIDTGGMSGPMGTWGASKEDFYKTFIKPFADVVSTTAGKTKELARKGVTLVQVAFEAIATTLLPFLSASYDEIFAKEKKDIQKIKNEYKSVYDATNKALMNSDVAMLAFFAYPGTVITTNFAKKSPKASKKILGIVTGGMSDKYLDKYLEKLSSDESSSKKEEGIDFYLRGFVNLLSEEKKSPKLSDVVASKKAVEKLLSISPAAAEMSRNAQEIYKKTLNDAYEQALSILSAKSVEEIEKIVGKKLKGTEKLRDIDPKEKEAGERQLLITVKKSIKELYTKRLQKEISDVVSAGIPEESQFVKDYLETIKKIQSI